MGFFSSCTKKTPVVRQPQVYNKPSVPAATIGTLNRNNNFGEHTQTLRQIQNTASTKLYRSDQLNLSPAQYKLLTRSSDAVGGVFSGLSLVCTTNNFSLATQKDVEDTIERQVRKSIEQKKILSEVVDEKIDLSQPLLSHSYDMIKCTANLLNNREKVASLSKNPDAKKFFDNHNFDIGTVCDFNERCLDIKRSPVPGSNAGFLKRMAECYACKGVLENQLPKIKQHFLAMKKSGQLDKEFMRIVESAIKSSEAGLINMNNPQRAAILEEIAPTFRPTSYGPTTSSISVFREYHSVLLEKSDAEVSEIFRKLKEIPILLS